MSEKEKTGVEPEFMKLWKSKMEELAQCPARKDAVLSIYKLLFGDKENPEIIEVGPQQLELDGFSYHVRRHIVDELHRIDAEITIESCRENYRQGAQLVSTPKAIGNAAFLLAATEVFKKHGFTSKHYSWLKDRCFKCNRITGIEYGIDIGLCNVKIFVTETYPCKCKH